MKNKIIRFLTLIAMCFALQFGTTTSVQAQCPMCKMSAEGNLKDGGTIGKGLNDGILYMFLTPYVIVGLIGFIWYRNRRSEDDLIVEMEE